MPNCLRHRVPRRVASLLALAFLVLNGLASAALAVPADPDFPWAVEAAAEDKAASWSARAGILIYKVQAGDSLWSIAARFDLDVDTLRWSNPEVAYNPDYLRLDQELIILPVRGAYVTVRPGDTIERLAMAWGVAPADIVNYPLNGLSPGEQPAPETKLVIPNGFKELNLAPPGPAEGYTYAWPIRGRITQSYSARHRAVDFGAPYGAKVYASRAGRCISAAWSDSGYGYLVIIAHDDGARTYYSHLKGAWVSPGQWVQRGGLVGEVGSTGNSTGPHVHFEIRISGVPQNPLDYLPPEP